METNTRNDNVDGDAAETMHEKPILRLAAVSGLLESSHSKEDGVVFRRSYLSMSTRTFDDDDDAVEYFSYVNEDVFRWYVELDRKWVKRRGLVKAKDYMRHALNLPEVRRYVGDNAAALLREQVHATWATREIEIMERRRQVYFPAVSTQETAAAPPPVETGEDVGDVVMSSEPTVVHRLLQDIANGQRELLEELRGVSSVLRDMRGT